MTLAWVLPMLVLAAGAGWLLVAPGVLPLVITVIGRSGPVVSLAAASVVPLIAGIVSLLSARMERGSSAPGTVRAAAGLIRPQPSA